MKKQRHNPGKRITATQAESAPSIRTPMNSTASFATVEFCPVSALTAYISRTGAYLRSLWSRLERLLRELQDFALHGIRWRIKWSIAWLRRYSLNLALFATITDLSAVTPAAGAGRVA